MSDQVIQLGNSQIFAILAGDPLTCLDTQGMASPTEMSIGIEIYNNEGIDVWIQVIAEITYSNVAPLWDPSWYWNAVTLTQNLGKANNASSTLKFFTPQRQTPIESGTGSGLVLETMKITLKAYKDAGYTQFHSFEETIYTFRIFDSSWSFYPDIAETAPVIINIDTFETPGVLDGWNNVGYDNVEQDNLAPYEGMGCLSMYSDGSFETDSAGLDIPISTKYIEKNFTVGIYDYAFIIIHYTRNGDTDGLDNTAVRFQNSLGDFVARTSMPKNTSQTWRVVFPIPVNATELAKISLMCKENDLDSRVSIDYIKVVAFSKEYDVDLTLEAIPNIMKILDIRGPHLLTAIPNLSFLFDIRGPQIVEAIPNIGITISISNPPMPGELDARPSVPSIQYDIRSGEILPAIPNINLTVNVTP